MRRFLVERPSSSCGGGRLFSVFLPTKDGALNGLKRPMSDFNPAQIYRWTNAGSDVTGTGSAIHLYF
jgi:hypothetical protein